MTYRKSIIFQGGPLDGVTWPCGLNVDSLVIRTDSGRFYFYETDQITEWGRGDSQQRMVPTSDLNEFCSEFANRLGEYLGNVAGAE